MSLSVIPLPSTLAADAEPDEVRVDHRGGAPLRCCLRDSRPGERLALVRVAPPGPAGPYAETGPVFLHADGCDGPETDGYPADFAARTQVLRCYDHTGRILGGEVVPAGGDHIGTAERLLADPEVAFLHTRNVVFGCYMLTLRRG
jgi:hypothetical protein